MWAHLGVGEPTLGSPEPRRDRVSHSSEHLAPFPQTGLRAWVPPDFAARSGSPRSHSTRALGAVVQAQHHAPLPEISSFFSTPLNNKCTNRDLPGMRDVTRAALGAEKPQCSQTRCEWPKCIEKKCTNTLTSSEHQAGYMGLAGKPYSLPPADNLSVKKGRHAAVMPRTCSPPPKLGRQGSSQATGDVSILLSACWLLPISSLAPVPHRCKLLVCTSPSPGPHLCPPTPITADISPNQPYLHCCLLNQQECGCPSWRPAVPMRAVPMGFGVCCECQPQGCSAPRRVASSAPRPLGSTKKRRFRLKRAELCLGRHLAATRQRWGHGDRHRALCQGAFFPSLCFEPSL